MTKLLPFLKKKPDRRKPSVVTPVGLTLGITVTKTWEPSQPPKKQPD